MYGRGKRFKTAKYQSFQNEIRDELLGTEWPFKDQQVKFEIEVGLSNRGADLDNTIKPILDTYQQIYSDFNDNKVYKLQLDKKIVKKSEEYIQLIITAVEERDTE